MQIALTTDVDGPQNQTESLQIFNLAPRIFANWNECQPKSNQSGKEEHGDPYNGVARVSSSRFSTYG
jgi:hypothetical protein